MHMFEFTYSDFSGLYIADFDLEAMSLQLCNCCQTCKNHH